MEKNNLVLNENYNEFINFIKKSILNNNYSLVFFVGSGVSTEAPSNILSTSEIIEILKNELFPDIDIKSLLIFERIFENLNFLAPYKNLSKKIIEIVDPSKFYEGYNLYTNLFHLILMYISIKYRCPIITCNFDLLFENAFKLLKNNNLIEPDNKLIVITPSNCERLKSISLNDEKINLLIKIHGSIDSEESEIRNTFHQIVAYLPEILIKTFYEIIRNYEFLCFIGYSGLDLDFFPQIVHINEDLNKKIFWIEPYIENIQQRVSYYDNIFKIINTNAHDLSIKYCELLDIGDILIEIIKGLKPLNKDYYKIKVKKYIEELMYDLNKDYIKYLFIGKILQEVGYEKTNIIEEYLQKAYEMLVNDKDACFFEKNRFLLEIDNQLSKYYYRINRFETAIKKSYSQMNLAKQFLLNLNKDEKNEYYKLIGYKYLYNAYLNIYESKLLQYDIDPKTFKYPYKNLFILSYITFNIFIQLYLLIFKINFKINNDKLMKIKNKNIQEREIIRDIKEILLEAEILFLSMPQRFALGIKNNKFSGIILNKLIKIYEKIKNESYSIGYAYGYFNSYKYILRIAQDLNKVNSFENIYKKYNILVDNDEKIQPPHKKAVILRDRAEKLMNSNISEAIKFFKDAKQEAYNSNAYSMIVKLNLQNLLNIVPENEKIDLLKETITIAKKIESKNYKKIANKLEKIIDNHEYKKL